MMLNGVKFCINKVKYLNDFKFNAQFFIRLYIMYSIIVQLNKKTRGQVQKF